MTTADDPDTYAAQHGVTIDHGLAQISVVLADGATEGDLEQRYDLVVYGHSRHLVDAGSPITRLCPLSDDPRVQSVWPLVRVAPAA